MTIKAQIPLDPYWRWWIAGRTALWTVQSAGGLVLCERGQRLWHRGTLEDVL